MALQEKHYHKAKVINDYVNSVLKDGGSDAEIMTNMNDYMTDFKDILDHTQGSEMDMLCIRYEGFFKFADLLQNLAKGIKNGDIDVPK